MAQGEHAEEEGAAEAVFVLFPPGGEKGALSGEPVGQALALLHILDEGDHLVVDAPESLPRLGGVFVGEVAGDLLDEALESRKGRGHDDAGLFLERDGKAPGGRDGPSGGGPLVVLDQGDARVLEREDGGAETELGRAVHEARDGAAHPELAGHVQLARLAGQVDDLLDGFQALETVVSRFGLDHALEILVHLLMELLLGQQVDEVLPADQGVDRVLAEEAFGASRDARGDAADDHRAGIHAPAFSLDTGLRRRGRSG